MGFQALLGIHTYAWFRLGVIRINYFQEKLLRNGTAGLPLIAAAGVRCLQPWTKRRLILLCVPVLSLVEVLQCLSYKRYIDRLGGSHTPVLGRRALQNL